MFSSLPYKLPPASYSDPYFTEMSGNMQTAQRAWLAWQAGDHAQFTSLMEHLQFASLLSRRDGPHPSLLPLGPSVLWDLPEFLRGRRLDGDHQRSLQATVHQAMILQALNTPQAQAALRAMTPPFGSWGALPSTCDGWMDPLDEPTIPAITLPAAWSSRVLRGSDELSRLLAAENILHAYAYAGAQGVQAGQEAGRREQVPCQDQEGQLQLGLACAHGRQADVVRWLLAGRADVNGTDQESGAPLMYAACRGHASVVDTLLQCGARCDPVDQNGHTPLLHAAHQGHMDVVRLLLARGACADHYFQGGSTALMMAAAQGHLELVRLLLASGASTALTTQHPTEVGHTALVLAANAGHAHVVQLLLHAAAGGVLPDGRLSAAWPTLPGWSLAPPSHARPAATGAGVGCVTITSPLLMSPSASSSVQLSTSGGQAMTTKADSPVMFPTKVLTAQGDSQGHILSPQRHHSCDPQKDVSTARSNVDASPTDACGVVYGSMSIAAAAHAPLVASATPAQRNTASHGDLTPAAQRHTAVARSVSTAVPSPAAAPAPPAATTMISAAAATAAVAAAATNSTRLCGEPVDAVEQAAVAPLAAAADTGSVAALGLAWQPADDASAESTEASEDFAALLTLLCGPPTAKTSASGREAAGTAQPPPACAASPASTNVPSPAHLAPGTSGVAATPDATSTPAGGPADQAAVRGAPPEHLCCPISQCLLVEPVIAGDGHTYSRAVIESWFQVSDVSPKSGQQLPHTWLLPNHLVAGLVHAWGAGCGAAVMSL